MMLSPLPLEIIVTLMLNIILSVLTQSTCGPKVSARLLMDIPCDMSKTNFCELSGTIYPWAAVRRYIYENQGLLRRMYGDQRHYQILTNEIQDLKEKYDNVFIYDGETKSYDSNHIFQHSPYFHKYQPQFRPRSFSLDDSDDDEDIKTDESKRHESPKINRSKEDKSDILGQDSYGSYSNNQTKLKQSDHSKDYTGQQQQLTNGTTGYTQAFLLKEENSDQDEQESTTISTASQSSSPLPSMINDLSSSSEPDYLQDPSMITFSESESTESSVQGMSSVYSSEVNHQQFSDSIELPSPSSVVTSSSSAYTSKTSTPAAMQIGTKSPSISTSSMESNSLATPLTDTNQQKQPDEQPTVKPDEPVKSKGVNACPVREEVIAPYWANNTRGEILALLNVYPFEQYVHWEKCAHENSQMFCRDGCRCEQQYRLHRLLAFDPKNECRGIFADWFRFPSCCVCICYDLPESNIFYRSNKRKSRL